MTVAYSHFKDFGLPTVEGADAVAARAALAERFSEVGYSIPMSEMSADELLALPSYVLIALKFDYNMAVTVFAVPEADLSATLRSALELANYSAWAYDELMYGDEAAHAYMRLDAAIMDDEELEETLESFEEVVPGFGATIPATERNCWAAHRVARFEHGKEPSYEPGAFDKRIVATYSLHRCGN
jgi:hypothetical protein